MADPQPTLRALLARPELDLRLASDPDAMADGALDTPLRWVHSSDLADPTPFLADDLLLLTTGTQFAGADGPAAYHAYVARLSARGVRGLGFGTEVVRDGIPPALVDACRRERMPLFEVPYRTPFIALARANAEAIAAEAYARRTWALAAQRAISLAALRPDGLAATVSELAHQLNAWVGLFDAAGTLTQSAPETGPAPEVLEAVVAEAGALLRRGARAASTLDAAGERITMQTLGRGGHLRGLLAIVGAELDLEGRSVVTSVIAMAGLSLEQNVGLGRARSALRAGLLQALLADEPQLPRRVARELWGPLPSAPVVVGVAPVASRRLDAAVDWLELRAVEERGAVFYGRGPDGIVVVVPAADERTAGELAALVDTGVGLSDPTDYASFGRAHAQAVAALRRASSGGVARFGDVAAEALLSSLDSPAVRVLADARLRPLRAHDAATGSSLVETLHAWLAHDARIDETARVLGIHRHTVRARVAQAERVLGTDLSAFPARAELWAALLTPPL
ncbi:helix-turn-helix domain-containing protein [Microbacterium dextranolyticum]|uniref:PucR family transcriptional regulator n=1 Tax=Microbacterium dextranolyticum TaxID=36806 RepID=A0A9W6HL12_9MICO|nr:PucR family transcriptional regulator ligand-binding domain-containing protein [Microbacterium dextranolyticum]MBM7462217.1 purine catabolism regulator [Microbacterium dextranolyticum]GLJ94468.1 PucR family transcriptional regulator [Microbacterium dextranolyticum]